MSEIVNDSETATLLSKHEGEDNMRKEVPPNSDHMDPFWGRKPLDNRRPPAA